MRPGKSIGEDEMDRIFSESYKSKHALIAEALSADIRLGRYKIGELLPSEPELSMAFGVSRHTVRSALRLLHGLGLVVSRQGIGTEVRKDRPASRYTYSFNSVSDLLQYATKTKVKVIDCVEIVVDEEGSRNLGCKVGEHWWRVRTVRFDATGSSLIAYSEIHVPLAFGSVLADSAKSAQAIFALIEQRFQEKVATIRQDIAAVSMTLGESTYLKQPKRSPGLEITRRYVGQSGRVLEIARSVHPVAAFKYSMEVQFGHGP